MASKPRRASAPDTLDEIESFGERAGEWLTRNARNVLLGGIACLAVAGGYGAWESSQRSSEEAASAALEEAWADYLLAMGAASPFELEVPELANPKLAREIRREYAERFRTVAEEHRGTVPAAIARLREAELRETLGDAEASLGILTSLAGDLSGEPRLQGLVLQRLAYVHEDAGRWLEAAEAHARAADLAGFPLRHRAMAAAARCFVEAGERGRARQWAQRLESEAPELRLPDHLRTLLRELRSSP